MSLLYIGRIEKLEIGVDAVTNIDVENVVLMNWERNHDVRPRLYANSKVPTTWQQPHSWIFGSFSLLSDNHTAIYATPVDGSGNFAMVENDDSNKIDFMQVTYEDGDGNNRTTRFYNAIIYRHNKELLNYEDSVWVYHFMAGYAVDASEGAIEYDLISSDAYADSVYIHVGATDTISTSFSAPDDDVTGIVIDLGGNLISAGDDDASIFIHVGVTDTISTSFSSPNTSPTGLTLDKSGNLISSDNSSNSVYIHVGITSTISTSFSGPAGTTEGLAMDEDENLVSLADTVNSAYIHVGITSTVSTSFSTPSGDPCGAVIDPAQNLISVDSAAALSIYIHDGITSTISTSFSSPQSGPGAPWGVAITVS